MAFLTMREEGLLAGFPCNSAGLSLCCTLPWKDPEHPWKASNLSPKPSPIGLAAGDDGGSASVARVRSRPPVCLGRTRGGRLEGLRAASGFTHVIVTSVRSPGPERAMLGSWRGRVNADEIAESGPGKRQVGCVRLARKAGGPAGGRTGPRHVSLRDV